MTPETSKIQLNFGKMSFWAQFFVTKIQNVRFADNWI